MLGTSVRSTAKVVDIVERVKRLVDTWREESMADGREKYWNSIRDDVKENTVDRVDDGLMN
jgi:molybdopterin synthase catalytic subunit